MCPKIRCDGYCKKFFGNRPVSWRADSPAFDTATTILQFLQQLLFLVTSMLGPCLDDFCKVIERESLHILKYRLIIKLITKLVCKLCDKSIKTN